MKKMLTLVALLAGACVAEAKVTLPSVFTNNMVLQQQRTLKICGLAKPSAEVSLQTGWSRSAVSATADASGKFSLEIQTPKAGGPYTLAFNDGEETKLENVMVGEIWIGSGQSNMEMPLKGWGKVLNYEEEIKNANFPNIRLFQVKKVTDMEEHDAFHLADNLGGWQPCSPETVHNFSALCYFYAVRLWEELKVPVGVIDDCWGGTPIEAWTRREVLESVYGSNSQILKDKEKNYDKDVLKKIFQSKKTLADQKLMNQPWWGEDPDHPHHPTVLWNAMMAPLKDFPVRGFLWYQGCSNVGNAPGYSSCFHAMIQDWREQWGDPEMPFYFVQLANFREHKDLQADSQWALLREAQASVLALQNTNMAVCIDLGTADDIHPKTKRELGARMAAVALHNTYGMKKVAYTAPIYKGYYVKGNEAHILFDRPVGYEEFLQDENLPGFIIAGTDHEWHVAKARTEGQEVIVSCDDVKVPQAVRYGWADNPTCTLKTKSNLHVAPFRTDNW